MDLPVFVLTLVFSLILTLMSFLGSKKSGWGMMGMFGAAIAYLCALVLAVDGDLTISGTTVLAAANGNFVSDFNMVTWIPISLALGETVVTIRRIFNI